MSLPPQQLHGKIEGPVLIDRDTELHGMITVGATVQNGVRFNCHGMITGDLTVEKGGEAIIHGSVNGSVWNHDRVTIYGTVDNVADSSPGCQTYIDPKALIRGRNP
jgi:cytoskeletal protein CcmA (bactofilin family)